MMENAPQPLAGVFDHLPTDFSPKATRQRKPVSDPEIHSLFVLTSLLKMLTK